MARFDTTQWSVVVSAGDSQTVVSRKALATLCERYWQPLYAYIRSRGYREAEAQDLTQEFFARIIEKETFKSADREKGRFRTFLLTALHRFLSDERDKRQAQKRGGGAAHLSIDFSDDHGIELAVSSALSPEQIFERRWALNVLEEALAHLREEYGAAGKSNRFEVFKSALPGAEEIFSYEEAGRKLGMSESAVKVSVHRFRKRYRKSLRETVAETLANDGDIEDELRYILEALSARR